jgi:hypothetical protein
LPKIVDVLELLELLDDAPEVVAHDAAQVEDAEPAVAVERAIYLVARDVPGVGGGDGVAGDLVDVADVEGAVVGEVEADFAVGRVTGRELGFDLEEVLLVGDSSCWRFFERSLPHQR